jgi:hypothetical protein
MLARVCSGALTGIDAVVVDVEIDMSLGLPNFNLYGSIGPNAISLAPTAGDTALSNRG